MSKELINHSCIFNSELQNLKIGRSRPLPRDEFEEMSGRVLSAAIASVPEFRGHEAVESALIEWRREGIHGQGHSFEVYQKSVEIAAAERLPVNEKLILLMSVVHDLSEFLPLIDHRQMQVIPSGDGYDKRVKRLWKEQNHAALMAWIISSLIRNHGFDMPVSLSRDIYYHDIFWDNPSREQIDFLRETLSTEGKVLADADRLVDGGQVSVEQMVSYNILRSWQYGVGREYFIRPLAAHERAQWQKRSGGYFDTLSPLLVEFAAPDYVFYTNAGKVMNREKKSAFRKSLVEFLGITYDSWQNAVSGWKKENGKYSVDCGLRGTELAFKTQGHSVFEIAEQLFHMPVAEYPPKSGRQYFGYSLKHSEQWIDPSILLYQTKKSLNHEVISTINAYEAMVETGLAY